MSDGRRGFPLDTRPPLPSRIGLKSNIHAAGFRLYLGAAKAPTCVSAGSGSNELSLQIAR